MKNDIEVSAVIPVFNDVDSLKNAIPESIKTLETVSGSFEIIVAEDGSTDGSRELVLEWEKRDDRVRLFHSDERLGRGRALNRAFEAAKGEIVCYYDVDLATDMSHLPELISHIRDGADAATGSRLLPSSDIVRTAGREVASRGYNMMVRFFLKSRLYDHQCGFKAFNRKKILELIPDIKSGHWFWDTEALVIAQKRGLRVDEFAVKWRTGFGTTVRPKDVFSMGSSVLELWWRLHAEKS